VILLLALLVFFLLELSGPEAVAFLFAACVLEGLEIMALRHFAKRQTREQPPVDPDDELVGLLGQVVTPCRPRGQVRVRGELWAAVCPEGAEPGASVRVESVDEDLTITVAARG
jgi:membrane protein implicated in regulation of membrane protease activity